jgi:hypothetical protein
MWVALCLVRFSFESGVCFVVPGEISFLFFWVDASHLLSCEIIGTYSVYSLWGDTYK